jgi:dihydroorotase
MGLAGVSVAAGTIALHTIFELIRGSRPGFTCAASRAAGVELVRRAKAEGLNVTADVSINSLLLTENDIGYFDSSARVVPVLRQQRPRCAVCCTGRRHHRCAGLRSLPGGRRRQGAALLPKPNPVRPAWSCCCRCREVEPRLQGAAEPRTGSRDFGSVAVLGSALGEQRSAGAAAGERRGRSVHRRPQAEWTVDPKALQSQGKSTPFNGYELPARVVTTIVDGAVAYQR